MVKVFIVQIYSSRSGEEKKGLSHNWLQCVKFVNKAGIISFPNMILLVVDKDQMTNGNKTYKLEF